MSRRVTRVSYSLDPKGIKFLPQDEIKAILRAADELIARGGRTLLAKILKGSKDKKIIELKLNEFPAYGYFRQLSIEEITAKLDWMIIHDYLRIQYDGRLPLIVFSDKGWEIERNTYADELLDRLEALFDTGDFKFVNALKDRNRGMILLLLEKIEATGDRRFIPLLKAWDEIEYKKVRKEIQRTISSLETSPSTE